MTRFVVILMVAGSAGVPAVDAAGEGGDGARPVPAEQRRLSTGIFREGLRRRGLHDLLDLHLKDFPLQSPVQEKWLQREVELARFQDRSRPAAERQAAIADANRLLEELIRDNPADPRRFEWMYLLAYSLVFEQAERPATNILYVGGLPDDRARLADTADRAVEVIRSLERAIEEEYARVDRMSPAELERLERTGRLEELDRIAPNAEYVLLWALFYGAISRPSDDPRYNDWLNEVTVGFSQHPQILAIPQEQSRVQVAALTLAGMTSRRLGRNDAARDEFDRARSVADRLSDPSERNRVAAPRLLAEIESVRNERDVGRWHAAESALAQLRRGLEGHPSGAKDAGVDRPLPGGGDRFLLRLVVALLERSVHRARADAIDETDRPDEAAKLRERAWGSLAQLAATMPARRDELYAVLYRKLGPDADRDRIDPVEQAALVAGLLSHAESVPGDADAAFARARRIAERFPRDGHGQLQALAADMDRRVAIAAYRRGDLESAGRRFLAVARDHPRSPNAANSAELAVQIASKLYADSPGSEERRRLYRQALELLIERFSPSESADYWRFFYADLLRELDEFDAAAAQFVRIEPLHPLYLEAGLRRVQTHAAAAQHLSRREQADASSVKRHADQMLTALRDLIVRAGVVRNETDDPDRRAEINAMVGEARLTAAEAAVLPPVGRNQQALGNLDDFESRYPQSESLADRVLRARLLALSGLGRFGDAVDLVPRYIAVDPVGAGRTLQAVFDSVAAELNALPPDGSGSADDEKAEAALLLARTLDSWTHTAPGVGDDARRAIRVQLGEANLWAGSPGRARQVFATVLPESRDSLPEDPYLLRAMLGTATADKRLGNCERALPVFNRLATGLAPASELRWEALVGDLTCRTRLGHDPEGIIRVLEQQTQLFPALGGPKSAERLARLLRENKRRLAGADSPDEPLVDNP